MTAPSERPVAEGRPFRPPHDFECPVCRADAWSQPERAGIWLRVLRDALLAVLGVAWACWLWEAGMLVGLGLR